jgi:hypothetical protein
MNDYNELCRESMSKFDAVQYRKLASAEEDVHLWLRKSEKGSNSNSTNSASHRMGVMRGLLNPPDITNATAVARRGATQ